MSDIPGGGFESLQFDPPFVREAHGTKAAAEHFNITAARIRALLPRAERGTSTVPGTVHRAK